MDKRNTLYKLVKMLEKYDGEILGINELTKLIGYNIGVSEQTIKSNLRALDIMGLIREIEHLKFKVKLPKHTQKKLKTG